jgi:hypothetical protein
VRINAAKQENDMKTKTTNSGLKVKANVKAGGFKDNHNGSALRVSKAGLKVKANVKAGGFKDNHNGSALRVTTGLKAGGIYKCNHTARLFAIA